MKDIKFKLTGESKVNWAGVTLFRIEAIVDIKSRGVQKGDKGGWLESEKLDNGNARVSGDAWVYGDAEVYGDAKAQYGYWFAHKNESWNVTEVDMGNGWKTLVKDYKPADEEPENQETIEIEGKKYTIDQIKKALGDDN